MADERFDEDILLETGLLAARLAGEMIAGEYENAALFQFKSDSSAVTPTDLKAEQIIKDVIRQRHPGHGFLGEEYGTTPSTSRFIWVVDPIDGTKNFLRGVPLFSVEIALIKDGVPYLGVSSLPAMHRTAWALRGRGAQSSTGPLAVSGVRQIEAAYVSFGNLKHFQRKGYLDSLLRLVNAAFQSRGIGDAWSFHLLAQGSIDIFVDASTVFWDVAALTTIVEEAGGLATDFNGKPISANSTSIVATNQHLHPFVLQCIQS